MHTIESVLAADAETWRSELDKLRPKASTDYLPSRAIRRTMAFRRWTPLASAAALAALIALTVSVMTTSNDRMPAGGKGTTPISTAGLARDPLQPSVPVEMQGRLSKEPVRLVSATDATTLTSMPWRLVGIDDSSHSLEVVYVAGDSSCVTPVGFYVQEDETSVVLEAVSRTDPQQRVCPSDEIVGSGRVVLRAPLGDRALYHAQTDPGSGSSVLP